MDHEKSVDIAIQKRISDIGVAVNNLSKEIEKLEALVVPQKGDSIGLDMLVNALKTIKAYCNEKPECRGCAFYDSYHDVWGCCKLTLTIPGDWETGCAEGQESRDGGGR